MCPSRIKGKKLFFSIGLIRCTDTEVIRSDKELVNNLSWHLASFLMLIQACVYKMYIK